MQREIERSAGLFPHTRTQADGNADRHPDDRRDDDEHGDAEQCDATIADRIGQVGPG